MKKLILVASPPASGKTYVSERLAKALSHVVYLDKDDLHDIMQAAFRVSGNEADMDSQFYIDNLRPHEYSTLLNIAFSALRYEDSVLLNAPFGKEVRDINSMLELKNRANDLGAELILIWVYTPVDICYERMKKRNAPRDIHKLEDWESYVKKINYTPPFDLETHGGVDHLILFETKDDAAFEKSFIKTLNIISGD